MVSTSTLPPSRAAAATRGRGRHRRLADAAGAAEHDDLAGGEQRLERVRPRPAALTTELLAERLGHHARDPQAVVAHEQVRQEQQREVDRVAQLGEVRRSGCGASRPRAARRRAPRSAPGPACSRRAPSAAAGARSASNTSSSAWVNSSGSTRFTITTPSGTLSSSRARPTSSIVSLTGISSGDVTTLSAVSAGSESSSTIQSVWLRTGPDLHELLDRLAARRAG